MIALTVIVLYLGVLALSPAIMAWVEARPTLIQNDLVVDFVNWYDPDAIADTPASSTYQRISVEIPPGATDSFIGDLLVGQGLIHSELAFHYQVYQAEREGTSTPASTTCHPRSCPRSSSAPSARRRGPRSRSPFSRGCASRSWSRTSAPPS